MIGTAPPVDLHDCAWIDFSDALSIEAAEIRPSDAAQQSKKSDEEDDRCCGKSRSYVCPFLHRRRHHTKPPNPSTLNGNSTSRERKMARIWLCVRMISL